MITVELYLPALPVLLVIFGFISVALIVRAIFFVRRLLLP